jgi:hypothetical protein
MKDLKYGSGLYGLGLDLNHHETGPGHLRSALIILGFIKKICLGFWGTSETERAD